MTIPDHRFRDFIIGNATHNGDIVVTLLNDLYLHHTVDDRFRQHWENDVAEASVVVHNARLAKINKRFYPRHLFPHFFVGRIYRDARLDLLRISEDNYLPVAEIVSYAVVNGWNIVQSTDKRFDCIKIQEAISHNLENHFIQQIEGEIHDHHLFVRLGATCLKLVTSDEEVPHLVYASNQQCLQDLEMRIRQMEVHVDADPIYYIDKFGRALVLGVFRAHYGQAVHEGLFVAPQGYDSHPYVMVSIYPYNPRQTFYDYYNYITSRNNRKPGFLRRMEKILG